MPILSRMEQRQTSEGYLSKQPAAAYADVSPRTLDYAVARGELTAFRLVLSGAKGKSRKLLFRKADIDKWISRFAVGGVGVDEVEHEEHTNRV
jgi:hypothetical protein